MASDNESLRAERLTYAALCRENTGAHMCDSGGVYGRTYDLPPPGENLPQLVSGWEEGGPPSLSAAGYLSAAFPIDRRMQADWEKASGGRALSWFESVIAFMTRRGYAELARDNTYNRESDLDQCFVWSVWAKPEPGGGGWREDDRGEWSYDREWWYLKDLVTVIHAHTGCDVRGGYSRPAFSAGADWEAVLCSGFCFGYEAESGTDAEGRELGPDALVSLSERWCTGWSACPWAALGRDIEEFLSPPELSGGVWSVKARDKDGNTLAIVPQPPLESW